MPQPRQALLFDLDGTLLDSRRAIVDAVATGIEEVARQQGHHELRADRRLIVEALGLPADEYFRRVLPATLLQHADTVKQAATRHEVDALAKGEGALYPGTIDTLEAFRRRGWRIAIVSNAQAPYFHAALEHLALADLVDHHECYEELPTLARPPYKQRLVERALVFLQVEASRAIMVGDRAEDLHAGRVTGCQSVGVLHGFGDAEELREADALVEDMAGLAAAVRELEAARETGA